MDGGQHPGQVVGRDDAKDDEAQGRGLQQVQVRVDGVQQEHKGSELHVRERAVTHAVHDDLCRQVHHGERRSEQVQDLQA